MPISCVAAPPTLILAASAATLTSSALPHRPARSNIFQRTAVGKEIDDICGLFESMFDSAWKRFIRSSQYYSLACWSHLDLDFLLNSYSSSHVTYNTLFWRGAWHEGQHKKSLSERPVIRCTTVLEMFTPASYRSHDSFRDVYTCVARQFQRCLHLYLFKHVKRS